MFGTVFMFLFYLMKLTVTKPVKKSRWLLVSYRAKLWFGVIELAIIYGE